MTESQGLEVGHAVRDLNGPAEHLVLGGRRQVVDVLLVVRPSRPQVVTEVALNSPGFSLGGHDRHET